MILYNNLCTGISYKREFGYINVQVGNKLGTDNIPRGLFQETAKKNEIIKQLTPFLRNWCSI